MKAILLVLIFTLSCSGLKIRPSKPDDSELVQTQEQFLGNMLWDFVDLVTFGVFEKKPKSKQQKDDEYRQENQERDKPKEETKKVNTSPKPNSKVLDIPSMINGKSENAKELLKKQKEYIEDKFDKKSDKKPKDQDQHQKDKPQTAPAPQPTSQPQPAKAPQPAPASQPAQKQGPAPQPAQAPANPSQGKPQQQNSAPNQSQPPSNSTKQQPAKQTAPKPPVTQQPVAAKPVAAKPVAPQPPVQKPVSQQPAAPAASNPQPAAQPAARNNVPASQTRQISNNATAPKPQAPKVTPPKANASKSSKKKVKISRASNSTNAPTTRTLQGQGTESAPAPIVAPPVTKKTYITEEDKNEIVNQVLNNKTLASSEDPVALKLQIAKMQSEMQQLKSAYDVEKQPISFVDPAAITPIQTQNHHAQNKMTPKMAEEDTPAPVAVATKSKRQVDSQVIETDLRGFRKEHNTATDTALIDEYFHSHSHLSNVDDDEARYLDEQHTLAAVDELFNRWEFTVTPEQYAVFKQDHFDKTWQQYSTDGRINLELAQDFVDHLIQATPEASAEQENAQVESGDDSVLY